MTSASIAPDFRTTSDARTTRNPHIERRIGGKDKTHSTAGAIHAIETFERTHGAGGALAARILAYLIASHHAGLYDWASATGERSDLCDRLFAEKGSYAVDAQREYAEALATAASGILAAPRDFDPVTAFVALPGLRDNPLGLALAVRMLFSCLVDADFLDTERFLQPGRFAARAAIPEIADLCEALDAFTAKRDAQLAVDGAAGTKVNRIRADVLAQCRSKAALPPGFFSLEVPTGRGKTLVCRQRAPRCARGLKQLPGVPPRCARRSAEPSRAWSRHSRACVRLCRKAATLAAAQGPRVPGRVRAYSARVGKTREYFQPVCSLSGSAP